MIGIIWYVNRKAGLFKFEELIEEYEKMGIEVIQESHSALNASVYFKNGDYWLLVHANDNSRGKSCNVALIEQGIPEDIIEKVIMPCIKRSPFRAYNYYGG